MTHRHKLEHHRISLDEIRNIMNSMKTLAYMETRKLTRFLESQQAVVKNIEDVAIDFLHFNPGTLPVTGKQKEDKPLYILIGTERGFCGDFNHALLKQLDIELEAQSVKNPALIGIGHKLSMLLENNQNVAALFDGVSVVEEATNLIQLIVNELATLQEQQGILTTYCIYHDKDSVVIKKLLPPFHDLKPSSQQFSTAPVLNLSPPQFFLSLTEHYLFAALYEILYTSLMQENLHRVSHLEGAIHHLDEESADLAQKCNTLRQEEIIEEIEVILLSASSLTEYKNSP